MAVEIDMMPRVKEIMAQNLTDIEKLTQAYVYLLEQHIYIARKEQELQKALKDKDALMKMKIQGNTLEYVLGMFKDCLRMTTERSRRDG